MKKGKFVVIISSILILIGLGLTIFESALVNDSVASEQQNVSAGGSMTAAKELDPSKNQNGIYSVQITDFKESDKIQVLVFNPLNEVIESKLITKSPIQENFSINTKGNYKIQIENQGVVEVQVLAIIGYYPQNILFLDTSGFIVLIIGLSGLAVGGMYFIKNRGKTNLS